MFLGEPAPIQFGYLYPDCEKVQLYSGVITSPIHAKALWRL